ncbi:MAG: Thermophilic metalloprotease superfamily [Candidatus Adlerbacteria bacterium]|nr:Thermophilic metalloprotease superfamily [Candidatus Adlerbacteria bacterium]
MAKGYAPKKAVLEKYADVLVNFALGGGKGIKKGDVVCINGSQSCEPLFLAVRNAVLDAGGHVIMQYQPEGEGRYNLSREFFERAKDHQLDHFPAKYYKGLIDEIDHLLFIVGDNHPHALKGIDPQKVMRRGASRKPFMDWRNEKEHAGKFTWCIALWGTPAMAKEAKLSIKEYWQQIIDACFLNEKDPIAKWKETYRGMEKYRQKLNRLAPQTDRLHVEGPDINLWIKLGEKRQWLCGSGRNIPSFEIFTSPDWRGTEGWIRFNQPLYRDGNYANGIELWFEKGKVVKVKAKKGEAYVKQMIAMPGADRVGEFSLTDSRHSRITKFMAETLYDENIGGPQGNTHIAVGSAYADTYAGDPSKLTEKDKERLGYNDSSVHTDMFSTARRTVTAHLKDGKTKVIYKDGQFVL